MLFEDGEREIDDVLSEIETFMKNQGVHIKINFDDAQETDESGELVKDVKVTNSLECAEGDMACKVPTLHEGLDRPE